MEYFDENENAYSQFGLDKCSTNISEIKRVHRQLAKLYHPDKGGDPEMATKLNNARDWLIANHERLSKNCPPPSASNATTSNDDSEAANGASGVAAVAVSANSDTNGKSMMELLYDNHKSVIIASGILFIVGAMTYTKTISAATFTPTTLLLLTTIAIVTAYVYNKQKSTVDTPIVAAIDSPKDAPKVPEISTESPDEPTIESPDAQSTTPAIIPETTDTGEIESPEIGASIKPETTTQRLPVEIVIDDVATGDGLSNGGGDDGDGVASPETSGIFGNLSSLWESKFFPTTNTTNRIIFAGVVILALTFLFVLISSTTSITTIPSPGFSTGAIGGKAFVLIASVGVALISLYAAPIVLSKLELPKGLTTALDDISQPNINITKIVCLLVTLFISFTLISKYRSNGGVPVVSELASANVVLKSVLSLVILLASSLASSYGIYKIPRYIFTVLSLGLCLWFMLGFVPNSINAPTKMTSGLLSGGQTVVSSVLSGAQSIGSTVGKTVSGISEPVGKFTGMSVGVLLVLIVVGVSTYGIYQMYSMMKPMFSEYYNAIVNFLSGDGEEGGAAKPQVVNYTPYNFADNSVKHCDLRGGTKSNAYCKSFARKSCENIVGEGHVQPCADILYNSCMIPEPIEDASDCFYLAQLECKNKMGECKNHRAECLLKLRNEPNTFVTCQKCSGLNRCIKMKQQQCEKQNQCWDDFLGFLKKTTGNDYAQVWHILKRNNIRTREQLRSSTNPMKFWPWYVGKQDSGKYKEILNAIMKAKSKA